MLTNWSSCSRPEPRKHRCSPPSPLDFRTRSQSLLAATMKSFGEWRNWGQEPEFKRRYRLGYVYVTICRLGLICTYVHGLVAHSAFNNTYIAGTMTRNSKICSCLTLWELHTYVRSSHRHEPHQVGVQV